MPTEIIQNLCAKVENDFNIAANNQPMDAMFTLANMHFALKNSSDESDKSLLKGTLSRLKSKIEPTQVKNIWNAVYNFPVPVYNTLGAHFQAALPLLKKRMICDIAFSIHIDKQALITLGQITEFYPMVFIALIRRELLLNKGVDPISENKIDCENLINDLHQPNYPGILAFLKQCSHFPEEDFVTLAKGGKELCQRIISDIRGSACEASLSFRFAKLFPELGPQIANNVQSILDVVPLAPKAKEVIVTNIKKNPAAFSQVKTDNKVELDPSIAKKAVSSSLPFSAKSLFSTSAGLIGFGAGVLAQNAGTVPALSAGATLLAGAAFPPAIVPMAVAMAVPAITASAAVGAAILMNNTGASEAMGNVAIIAGNGMVKSHEAANIGRNILLEPVGRFLKTAFNWMVLSHKCIAVGGLSGNTQSALQDSIKQTAAQLKI